MCQPLAGPTFPCYSAPHLPPPPPPPPRPSSGTPTSPACHEPSCHVIGQQQQQQTDSHGTDGRSPFLFQTPAYRKCANTGPLPRDSDRTQGQGPTAVADLASDADITPAVPRRCWDLPTAVSAAEVALLRKELRRQPLWAVPASLTGRTLHLQLVHRQSDCRAAAAAPTRRTAAPSCRKSRVCKLRRGSPR